MEQEGRDEEEPPLDYEIMLSLIEEKGKGNPKKIFEVFEADLTQPIKEEEEEGERERRESICEEIYSLIKKEGLDTDEEYYSNIIYYVLSPMAKGGYSFSIIYSLCELCLGNSKDFADEVVHVGMREIVGSGKYSFEEIRKLSEMCLNTNIAEDGYEPGPGIVVYVVSPMAESGKYSFEQIKELSGMCLAAYRESANDIAESVIPHMKGLDFEQIKELSKMCLAAYSESANDIAKSVIPHMKGLDFEQIKELSKMCLAAYRESANDIAESVIPHMKGLDFEQIKELSGMCLAAYSESANVIAERVIPHMKGLDFEQMIELYEMCLAADGESAVNIFKCAALWLLDNGTSIRKFRKLAGMAFSTLLREQIKARIRI